MFNLRFYFLLFDNSKPRYKLIFQLVRNLLAKIVITQFQFLPFDFLFNFPVSFFHFLTFILNLSSELNFGRIVVRSWAFS